MPGVTTFHFSSTVGIPGAAVKAFFTALQAAIPSSVTLKFPSTGMNIDEATGQPVGTWSATAPTDLVGTGSGNYSRAVGALANWKTGTFTGGRELRGKTFMVPLTAAAFDANGDVSASTASNLASAGATLIAAGSPPLIYSRKAGLSAAATSCTVPRKTVVLRSRRD